MGKLLNTTFKDSVEDITSFNSKLVNNPFYLYNNEKPLVATYYNINKDFSSLDPNAKIQMSDTGEQSPFWYNKIEGMLLFGSSNSRIELMTEIGDFGLEGEQITGEFHILPNTIIPYEGDFFVLNHIKDSRWMFQVMDVQKDTLDNGSNAYKITYKLRYESDAEIQQNVKYNFRMIEKREGSNIASVVRCEDYDIAIKMDEKAILLKTYFKDLFYNDKVQTFIFEDLTEYRVYDPYMIEFLIRNAILEDNPDNYIYVTQQIPIPATFGIDYNKSFLRMFEKKDKDRLVGSSRELVLAPIKHFGTTFASRYEGYYKATYATSPIGYSLSCFSDNDAIGIVEHLLYKEPENLWKNILVKYFYDEDLTYEELDSIDEIDFKYSKDAFYLIPLLIFCLEKNIEKALK